MAKSNTPFRWLLKSKSILDFTKDEKLIFFFSFFASPKSCLHTCEEGYLYEKNLSFFPFIPIAILLITLVPVVAFRHVQPTFKPKNTIRKFILAKTNEEQLVEDNDETIDCIKKSIEDAANVKFNHFKFFIFIVAVIVEKIIILSALSRGTFQNLIFEWLHVLFYHFDLIGTRNFPRKVICLPALYYLVPRMPTFEQYQECLLNLNSLFETIYLALWFWILVLIFATILSLIQHYILMVSTDYRLARLRALLPSIEESSLTKFASNKNLFFILEIISSKMNNPNEFQRLMKILIDENYNLEHRVEKIDDV